MSYTWANFREAVSANYHIGAQGVARERAALDAVADLVKGRIVRETQKNLELSKSYLNSYRKAKAELLGYILTSDFSTIKAQVRIRITVDANRIGISETGGYNDSYIQSAMDDLNGGAIQFEELLLASAIELQRHVPCLQAGHRDSYLLTSPDIYNEGMATRLTLPSGSEVLTLSLGDIGDPLLANTSYVLEDYVWSNGRIYQCSTTGVTGPSLGDGLTSLDEGEQQPMGTAYFTFVRPVLSGDLQRVSYKNQQSLIQGNQCPEGVFLIDAQAVYAWVSPSLRDDQALFVDWNGIKTSFSDSDATPFDRPSAQFAAEWIRGMAQKNISEDVRAAGVSFSVAQGYLKRLWIECAARL